MRGAHKGGRCAAALGLGLAWLGPNLACFASMASGTPLGVALLAAFYELRVRYLKQQFNIGMEARINEEFHDTLLQSFQGVLMKFSALTYLIPERPGVRKKLEGVIEQARAAVTEGRDARQERAQLCGGKLAVWSEPGSGTGIELAAASQSAASGRGTE